MYTKNKQHLLYFSVIELESLKSKLLHLLINNFFLVFNLIFIVSLINCSCKGMQLHSFTDDGTPWSCIERKKGMFLFARKTIACIIDELVI